MRKPHYSHQRNAKTSGTPAAAVSPEEAADQAAPAETGDGETGGAPLILAAETAPAAIAEETAPAIVEETIVEAAAVEIEIPAAAEALASLPPEIIAVEVAPLEPPAPLEPLTIDIPPASTAPEPQPDESLAGESAALVAITSSETAAEAAPAVPVAAATVPAPVDIAPVAPAPVAPLPERDALDLLGEQLERLSDLDERAHRQLRMAKALDLVSYYTVWSGAAGLLPVPMLDIVTVISVQTLMLSKLAKIYGTSLKQQRAQAAVSVLVSSLLSSRIGLTVASSLSKLLPGWSDYVGGTVTSCVAGSMTYAIGRAFILGFETEGAALDFNAETLRRYFQRSFDEEKQRRQAKMKSWLKAS